jgi:hypothetical protein
MTKSDNMKAHTPAYKQQNDLAEAKLAKDEREKVYKLVSEARAASGGQTAILRLCDALERILAGQS